VEDTTAHLLLEALAGYFVAGAAVGVPFIVFGIGRVDPGARGAPWAFRLIVLPGVIALWPWIAARWILSRASA
jgi:hypothetical protein